MNKDEKKYEDGEPCRHPGCLSHISHPCEDCGRIAGKNKPSCSTCGDIGDVTVQIGSTPENFDLENRPCPNCNGNGKQPDSSEEIRENLINLRRKCHYCTTCDSPIKDDSGDCIRTCHYYTKYLNEKRRDDSSDEIREALSEYLKKIGWLLDSQIKEGEKKYLSPVSFGYKSATAKAQAEIEEYKAENQLLKNRVRRRAKTLFEMRSRIKELEQKYEPEK